MRGRFWIFLAVAVSAGIALWGTSARANAKKDLFEMKTWTRKDCSLTPWLVADRLGYFAEEGIKVVYTGETQPALQVPSLLRGNNDVGGGHPNTLAVANSVGAKLVAVMESIVEPAPGYDPKFRHMWWFVNPTKHPKVKKFSDLKNVPGKLKFSTISKNICTDFLTNIIADRYGIPRDKIEWVSMPDVQAVQALKQGLVDVAGVHPPFYRGMLDAKEVKIADSTETGLGASAGLTYYWFTSGYIKKHPSEVAGFVRAMKRGQRWANTHPEKAAKWVEEAIGVPVTGNHYYSENATIVEKEIEPWLRYLEETRILPKGKVTVSSLVTHQFEAYGNTERSGQHPKSDR
ncbi:ABC transporter substrate-binding protein [Geomesophilobacter sediminis]|uniref:ABC transporter substrate-binding protein n=1 Tax=Geomesophilobacter sediminis TaxID=2798584 RepID=A0A8J7JB69_9BACT|nr:ABC transporter substrate-binding protein [Geomesophilobacter sediminis]MBJ6724326.1 ABC transporter substrate-binding protein [Geomesophilobacter sediminis]